MKDIELIKNHLQQAITLAQKVGFSNAYNFDLEDFTYNLEKYVDELNDIGDFEVYPDELEEGFIRMNQLAGIITEGQARKMMAVLNEDMGSSLKVNLAKIDALPGVEKMAPKYLNLLKQKLGAEETRKYLIWSIQGHTAGIGDEALKYAKQKGTLDQYSDLELAKLDLGLNFNTYYNEEGDIVTNDMVVDYVEDSVGNYM